MRPCPYCAQPIGETEPKCPFCQAPLVAPPGAVPGSVPAVVPHVGPPETSGKAIGSLVSGILCFFWPASIVAIVLGHISRSEIRRSNGRLQGSGMALAGLILGYIGVSIVPILIIAAIAIPNLLKARMAANEASAAGSIRTLNTACLSYKAQYRGSFPPALANLGPGSPASAEKADLVDAALAGGLKAGYVFTYTSYITASPEGSTAQSYSINADPVKENNTGRLHFFTDQSGVIRSSSTGPATGESPPVE